MINDYGISRQGRGTGRKEREVERVRGYREEMLDKSRCPRSWKTTVAVTNHRRNRNYPRTLIAHHVCRRSTLTIVDFERPLRVRAIRATRFTRCWSRYVDFADGCKLAERQ